VFTGIIEELGRISSLEKGLSGARITVAASDVTSGLSDGDSVAINGVCLTAVETTPAHFSANVSPETLQRTTLGGLKVGSSVNLERAMLPTTRFGGHIVQGHVDGTGTLNGAVADGDFWTVTIAFPPGLSQYFVEKGSVSVEGISLTIARLHDSSFDIAIIPTTWRLTNLSALKQGDHVNLEVDVIAKYVERMIGSRHLDAKFQ
jgi:riboflavin synthase